MRILFLCDNFPPEVNAPATRTFEHCKEWVKLGEEVTVITCAPNFPQGKVYKGYKNKFYQKEVIEGIRVIRVWSYIAPNAGFVKRIIDFTSYALMAFCTGLFIKCDILVGTTPQFFTALATRSLAFFKRKPWIMEVRDIWPESIVAVGAMKKSSFTFKILHRIEKRLYRKATAIVPVTDSFKKYISKFTNPDKIHVIKNGVDIQIFSPVPKSTQLLEKLELKQKLVVGYIGTHGMAHGLHFILESITHFEDRNDIHFLFIGDGAEKEDLVRKANSLNLENVTFLPFVPKNQIKKYISILDVSLVNLKDDETFKSVIPSKIFENASMEKPILLGVEGESKKLIEKYNAGISFKPENHEEFISAVEKISDPKTYQEKVIGCRRLAEDFDRSTLAKRMLLEIKRICKN